MIACKLWKLGGVLQSITQVEGFSSYTMTTYNKIFVRKGANSKTVQKPFEIGLIQTIYVSSDFLELIDLPKNVFL